MEPASPSDYSQHGFAEEIVYDDTYDYCNEGLFNNGLIDLEEDLKPDPSILMKADVLVIPLGKLPEDLCYDDKLKIPSSESVLLGSYGPLPTVVEDEFYDFPLQPEAKAAQTSGPETLMEFECVSGNMELMNHLTPPQTRRPLVVSLVASFLLTVSRHRNSRNSSNRCTLHSRMCSHCCSNNSRYPSRVPTLPPPTTTSWMSILP